MPAHRHAIVALNAASNYARFVAAAVATFWLTPHLVGSLGAENYGLWTLAISVAGYLELLDCGLAAATMRFVAARGSDSDNDKRALVSTLNWLALALGVIVLVLGGSVAAIWHGPLGTLILLVTLRVSCNVMLSVFMGALFGEHRIWLINFVRTFSVIAFSVAAYLALEWGHGWFVIGVIHLVVYGLEYLCFAGLARLTLPWIRLLPSTFDRGLVREVFGFGMATFTANSANVVQLRTDPFIVSAFAPLGAVTLYAVPLRVTEQLFVLSKQLVNVFSPVYAELHGNDQRQAISRAYLTCTRLAFGLFAGIVLPAFFFGRQGLILWMGPEFAAAAPILYLLLAAALLRLLQESANNALAMTGHHRVAARVTLISAFANVFGSIVLAPIWGLTGIALATLVSVGTCGAGQATWHVCQRQELSGVVFARRVLLPTAIPAMCSLIVLLGLQSYWPASTLLGLLLHSACAGMTYLAAFAACSLEPAERSIACRLVGSVCEKCTAWLRAFASPRKDASTSTTLIQEPHQ